MDVSRGFGKGARARDLREEKYLTFRVLSCKIPELIGSGAGPYCLLSKAEEAFHPSWPANDRRVGIGESQRSSPKAFRRKNSGRFQNKVVSMLKKLIRRALNSLGYDVVRYEESGGAPEPPQGPYPHTRPEFTHLELGGLALQRLLDDCQFETVLDIGCGAGEHSDIFIKYGKQVTAVDFGRSAQFGGDKNRMRFIAGDFNEVTFPTRFDCAWACHVLEHQFNVNSFLRRVFDVINDDGVLAITVPPLKHQIVGGHVNLWNGGLLLYNLVLAGFDCKEARLYKYGYNISVIVKKKLAPLPTLAYDTGDIDRIAHFLPPGFRERFDGDIEVIDH